MMRVCFDYRVAVKLTQRKKRAASQSCSPNALRAKVDRTFNKRFKSGNSCLKNLTTGRVLRVESFFTTSLEKTPLTAASYNIEMVFFGGIGSGSFSNYPRGYWGATVIACDAETEEWVLRFDEAYGDLWDAGWRFDDPPESDLQFQRTGREMVFCGEIEEDDDIPIYVPKKE